MLSSVSSSAAIGAAQPAFALLPVGSCEQHGPHLPVGSDALIATAIAEGVCRESDAWLLPTLPYGTSGEHRGFPGTVSLRPETLALTVEDIAREICLAGIPRLVVLSGHGGNFILAPAIRYINVRLPRFTVLLVPERVMWPELDETELHAGGDESSIILHLLPDSVGELPPGYIPDAPREALNALPLKALSPSGIWGNPQTATSDRGATLCSGIVRRVVDYINSAFLLIDRVKTVD